MKKIIFLMVCAFVSLVSFAAGDGEVVEVPMTPNSLPNRGEVSVPMVEYSTSSSSLTIEFESSDSFTLVIEDANGITWYSGPLNTSGIPTVYNVNLQTQNTYSITISSATTTYSGVLVL